MVEIVQRPRLAPGEHRVSRATHQHPDPHPLRTADHPRVGVAPDPAAAGDRCLAMRPLLPESRRLMPRLMSVSHTTAQVRDRSKTVTRRLGWLHARVGQELVLCEKVMGRRSGEPLVRLATVRICDVRRERLDAITAADVAREGFPGWTPAEFVAFFCSTFRVEPQRMVTRIEWVYIDPADTP